MMQYQQVSGHAAACAICGAASTEVCSECKQPFCAAHLVQLMGESFHARVIMLRCAACATTPGKKFTNAARVGLIGVVLLIVVFVVMAVMMYKSNGSS
jgi:hypothetical protein